MTIKYPVFWFFATWFDCKTILNTGNNFKTYSKKPKFNKKYTDRHTLQKCGNRHLCTFFI